MSLGFLGLHLLSIQCILFHSASPAATRVRPALLFYQRCAFSSLLGFWSLCLALAASSSLPPTYTRAKLKEIFAFQIIRLVILPWMVLLHAHYPSVASHCCRKEDPFQGPKLGSRLTLGKELSEETHVLTKQVISLGKGTRVESRRVREPRRTALPCGLQSYGDGISFPVVFSQSF